MALLITLFLVLVNIFNNINSNSPKAEGLTAIEIWMLACILFVFGLLTSTQDYSRHVLTFNFQAPWLSMRQFWTRNSWPQRIRSRLKRKRDQRYQKTWVDTHILNIKMLYINILRLTYIKTYVYHILISEWDRIDWGPWEQYWGGGRADVLP